MPSNYAAVKAWRHRNAESARTIAKVAKGLKRSKAFATYWPRIVEYYGPCCRCRSLGVEPTTTACVDHVLPYMSDPLGRNVLTNLQPLCRACNSRKGNGIDDYRPDKGGFIAKITAGDPQARRPLHRGKWRFAKGLNMADYPERFPPRQAPSIPPL